MIQRIKTAYRFIIDHLTKILGGLGAGLMSWLSMLDPAQLRSDVQTYLGNHAAEKVASLIFGLVIVRGIYTGWKHNQDKQ